MSDRLPQLVSQTPRGADGIELGLCVQPELLWFQGHFPDHPILPGVVQIHWALDFARRFLGVEAEAATDFQVKFKAVIVPGDKLALALTRNDARRHVDFEYRRDGQVCASGRIKLP